MTDLKISLLARNKQDEVLTGHPQYTYFKYGQKPHYNFGSEWNILELPRTSDDTTFTFGNTYYFEIPKNGDVLSNVTLRIGINQDSDWNSGTLYETAFFILDQIELLLNDTTLMRLRSEYIYAWWQLYMNTSQFTNMINSASYSTANQSITSPTDGSNKNVYLHLPIPFWFQNNPDTSFPLWACQSDRLGIRIKLREDVFGGSGKEIRKLDFLCKFDVFDEDARRSMENESLEYVIEQVEEQYFTLGSTDTRARYELDRWLYVKEIIWMIQNTGINYFDFRKDTTTDGTSAGKGNNIYVNSGTLTMNGNALVSEAPGSYFNLIQRYQSHTNASERVKGVNEIYCYNFSLDTQNNELSGMLSTDKFNNSVLELNLNSLGGTRVLRIYQRRMNILRIKDGHGTLLQR